MKILTSQTPRNDKRLAFRSKSQNQAAGSGGLKQQEKLSRTCYTQLHVRRANNDQLQQTRPKSNVNEATDSPHGQWLHVRFFNFYALRWHKNKMLSMKKHTSNFEMWILSRVTGMRDDAGHRLPSGRGHGVTAGPRRAVPHPDGRPVTVSAGSGIAGAVRPLGVPAALCGAVLPSVG